MNFEIMAEWAGGLAVTLVTVLPDGRGWRVMNWELAAEWAWGLMVTLTAVLAVLYALIVLMDNAEWRWQKRVDRQCLSCKYLIRLEWLEDGRTKVYCVEHPGGTTSKRNVLRCEEREERKND